MRTEFCELIGIDLPIVQAPIGTAATPRLAAAVLESGALGMLASSWPADPASQVRELRELTSRPFGVNLVLEWDQHRRLDALLEAGARIVSPYPVDIVALPGYCTPDWRSRNAASRSPGPTARAWCGMAPRSPC